MSKKHQKPKRIKLKLKIKKPQTKKGWILAILLAVTSLYLYIGIFFAWGIYVNGKIGPSTIKILNFYPFPAARVGTTIIPLSRYLRDVNAIKQYIEVSGTTDQYAELVVENEVLDRLIKAALFERIARRYGIKITAEEVDAAYQTSAEEEGEPVERVLERYYGFIPEDFKTWIEEYLLEEKVRAEVPKKRSIQHILLSLDPNADENTVKEKEEKAKALMEELKGEADFAEVAKRESNDLTTRDNAGNLGTVSRGTADAPVIDKEFEDAAFGATVGELTGPVKTSRGWHIIFITTEEGKVEGNIEDIIEQEKKSISVSEYVPLPL